MAADREPQELAVVGIEWDGHTDERLADLVEGDDEVYHEILVPHIIGLALRNPRHARVLDVGCGLGFLSSALRSSGADVVGVDVSSRSVAVAASLFPSVKFVNQSVETFVQTACDPFDVAIANMVLHTTPALDSALRAIRRALGNSGVLILSLPHPCFWPSSRKDKSMESWQYDRQAVYSVTFGIHGRPKHTLPITYYHRPLEDYAEALRTAGFRTVTLLEPLMPQGYAQNDVVLLIAECSESSRFDNEDWSRRVR